MNLLLSTTQKNICNHQRKLQAHVLIPRFFLTYIYLLCQFNGVPFAFIVAQEKRGKKKAKIQNHNSNTEAKFDIKSKVDQYNGGMKKVGHDIIEKSLLLLVLPGKNGFSKDDLL